MQGNWIQPIGTSPPLPLNGHGPHIAEASVGILLDFRTIRLRKNHLLQVGLGLCFHNCVPLLYTILSQGCFYNCVK